jgi:hypothetical protein
VGHFNIAATKDDSHNIEYGTNRSLHGYINYFPSKELPLTQIVHIYCVDIAAIMNVFSC